MGSFSTHNILGPLHTSLAASLTSTSLCIPHVAFNHQYSVFDGQLRSLHFSINTYSCFSYSPLVIIFFLKYFFKCYSTLRKEKYYPRLLAGFQEARVRGPLRPIFIRFLINNIMVSSENLRI